MCKQNNITITELERILHYGNGTIHRWAKVQPSFDKVKAVAEHFNVSIDYLAGKSDRTSQDELELLKEYASFSPEQKEMARCYFTIVKNQHGIRTS